MSEEEILYGVLKHEVGHYMLKYYPWDLTTKILQDYEVSKITGEELKKSQKAQNITGLFNDIGVNLHLLLKKRDDNVAKLINKSFERKSEIGKLILGYYQQQSGYDFGIEIDKKLKSKIEEMNKIDFFEKDKKFFNLKNFSMIVNGMISGNEEFNIEKI